MSKLPVAIIGAGYWGPNLIRNFSSCPLTEVVAVCDANPSRLEQVGRQWGHLKLVSSLEEVIDEGKARAVAIATPVSTHYAIGKRCLEAGLDVMIEKPLASTVQEAQALAELADRKGRVLMVDHTYLFSNPVKLIKKLIDSGELGDLYYIDSTRINLGLFQHDVNVIWDLAPHDLSIVDHVVGRPARSISAWGCAHANPDIEDIAYVNVDYDDRMLANFHVNWLSPVKVRQMIFAGSKKSIIFNELNAAEPVKVYGRGIDLGDAAAGGMPGAGAGGVPGAVALENGDQRRRLLVSYRAGDVWSPHVEPGEALQAAITHFAECVRDGNRPISDGHLGVRVIKSLEAATRSIRAQGGRVILSNGEHYRNGGANGHSRAFRPGQLSSDRERRDAGEGRQYPLLREPLRL